MTLFILYCHRHLDISQSSDVRGRSNEKNGTYERPNQTLAIIVESLPFLRYLDISGTNLAGTGFICYQVEISELNPYFFFLHRYLQVWLKKHQVVTI